MQVEEEVSSEQPPDTLADEEEYEKRQEELRREEEQSSHSEYFLFNSMGVYITSIASCWWVFRFPFLGTWYYFDCCFPLPYIVGAVCINNDVE